MEVFVVTAFLAHDATMMTVQETRGHFCVVRYSILAIFVVLMPGTSVIPCRDRNYGRDKRQTAVRRKSHSLVCLKRAHLHRLGMPCVERF